MNSEKTFAILPLRSLYNSKRRLSDVLAVHERATLVQQLFLHTHHALVSSEVIDIIGVVSPDPDVLEWTTHLDVLALQQPGQGLNEGLEYARDVLLQGYPCARLLVVLPDLPLISGVNISAMVELGDEQTVVLAPDRHGRGTNALLACPARGLPFCFGDDSLRLHIEAVYTRGLTCILYHAPGTALDLDTSDDLRYMQQLPGCGELLQAFLDRLPEPRTQNRPRTNDERPTTNDER